jgi:ABC transport system ATP-binding/permease protein
MERDIAKLADLLAEPDLYRRDRPRYDKASATLAQLQAKHSASEEEWLRLEMLRDEAGSP